MFTRLGSQSIDLWIARTSWHCLCWIDGTRVCRALNTILWFVAQTWFFPQLIAVITYNIQLISAMYMVRSCPETSPYNHLILAFTGNLQLVSTVHLRPSSETSPCDHFIVAITGNLQLISTVHLRPSSETSPCDHFIVAITGNLQLVSTLHLRPSSEIVTLTIWFSPSLGTCSWYQQCI